MNERGMTLFEILIVVGIIGSLIAVLLPNIRNQQAKAKAGETRIKMGKVISQLNLYNNDCNKWPESLDSLVTEDTTCGNWGPEPYLKKKELEDGWARAFQYGVEGNSFLLKSLGADGREGGDKYDKDITQDDLQ